MSILSVRTMLRMAIAEYQIKEFPEVREFKYSAEFVYGNAIMVTQIEDFFKVVRDHSEHGLLLVDTNPSIQFDCEVRLLFIQFNGLMWYLNCGVRASFHPDRTKHVSLLVFIPFDEKTIDTNPPVIIVEGSICRW